jgi:hypothetical protein
MGCGHLATAAPGSEVAEFCRTAVFQTRVVSGIDALHIFRLRASRRDGRKSHLGADLFLAVCRLDRASACRERRSRKMNSVDML